MAVRKKVNVHININTREARAQLGKTEKEFGGFFKSVGKMAAGFVVGEIIVGGLRQIGMALTEVGKEVIEFDQLLKNVSKTTDISGRDLENLSKQFLEISKNVPVASKDLVQIAVTAGQLGIKGVEEVAKFSESIAKISVATGLSADDAATSFAQIANAAGLPVTSIENIASAINELENTSAATVSQIVGSIQRIGGTARILGVTVDQTAALSAALINLGIPAEEAGTSLKNAFIFAVDKAEEFGKVIGKTGEETRRAFDEDAMGTIQQYITQLTIGRSNSEALALATEIFGTRSSKAILALSKDTETLNKFLAASNQEFKEATSIQKEFQVQSQGAQFVLQGLFNQFDAIAKEIGLALLPAFIEGTQLITNFIREFSKSAEFDIFLEGISSIVQKVVQFMKIIGNVGIIQAMRQELGVWGEVLATVFSTISSRGKTFSSTFKVVTNIIKALFAILRPALLFIVKFFGIFHASLNLIITNSIKLFDIFVTSIARIVSGIVGLFAKIPILGERLGLDNWKKSLDEFLLSTKEKTAETAEENVDTQIAAAKRMARENINIAHEREEKIAAISKSSLETTTALAMESAKQTTSLVISEQEKRFLKLLGVQAENQTKELSQFAMVEAKKLGVVTDRLNSEERIELTTKQQISEKLLEIKRKEAEAELRIIRDTQAAASKNLGELIGTPELSQLFETGGMGAGISGLAGSAITTIGQGAGGAQSLITGLATTGATAAFGPMGAAAGPLIQLLSQPTEQLKETINQFADALPEIILRIAENIPVVIEVLAAKAPMIIDKLVEGAPEVINKLVTFFQVRSSFIAAQFAIAMAKRAPFIAAEMGAEFVKQIPTIAKSMIKELSSGIKNIFSSLGGLFGGGGLFGFAQGGVVPGTSYEGDRVLARVNSGERILTAQQNRLFEQLVGLSGEMPRRERKNGNTPAESSSGQIINITINAANVQDEKKLTDMIIDRLRTESQRGRKIIESSGIGE